MIQSHYINSLSTISLGMKKCRIICTNNNTKYIICFFCTIIMFNECKEKCNFGYGKYYIRSFSLPFRACACVGNKVHRANCSPYPNALLAFILL